MSKKEPDAVDAAIELTNFVRPLLKAADFRSFESLFAAYENAVNREHETEVDEARDEGFSDGKDEGYETGHAEAIGGFAVGGQTKIDVLATLRRLDFETACPFTSKAFRALADAVEAA